MEDFLVRLASQAILLTFWLAVIVLIETKIAKKKLKIWPETETGLVLSFCAAAVADVFVLLKMGQVIVANW